MINSLQHEGMFTVTKSRSYLFLGLLPFLLLPSSFPFPQIKAWWCLFTVSVLPGYLALSFANRQFRSGDLFEKATLALAVSLVLRLLPRAQIFLLRRDLWIVVATILGFGLILLLFVVVTHRPAFTGNVSRCRAQKTGTEIVRR